MTQELQTKVRMIEISGDQAGQRIDNFLIKILKGVPRTYIYRILRKGEVRVNRGRVKPVYRILQGDTVRVPPLRMSAGKSVVVSASLSKCLLDSIIYEDEHLLIINKPTGLAVHSGTGIDIGVIEALRQMMPNIPGLELVHRLDRDTSGCLLLSKDRDTLGKLHHLLHNNAIKKEYVALLARRIVNKNMTVNARLKKNTLESGERIVTVDDDGKHARTHFTLIKRFDNTSFCRIRIETGRTHQIRVHAKHIGHPIIGDPKYGDDQRNKLMKTAGSKKMFLHAWRLTLSAPFNIKVTAPLPAHFVAVTGINNVKGLSG